MPFPIRERHQLFCEASYSFLSFRFRCASVTGYAVHGSRCPSACRADEPKSAITERSITGSLGYDLFVVKPYPLDPAAA